MIKSVLNGPITPLTIFGVLRIKNLYNAMEKFPVALMPTLVIFEDQKTKQPVGPKISAIGVAKIQDIKVKPWKTGPRISLRPWNEMNV